MARGEIIEGVSFGAAMVLLPFLAGVVYIGYRLLPYLSKVYDYLFAPAGGASMDAEGRPVYRQQECPICLERVQLETSGTCGHTFCSHCLFEIYDRAHGKINCPACRRPITTMLRIFVPHNPPTREEENFTNRIKEYNYLYDDNRGILRCLIELPVLWAQIRSALSNPRFFYYLLRNFGRFRAIFFLSIYILSPFDILPQSFYGVVGLIDDFVICFIVLALVSQAVMAFIRHQQ